jgi:hypothetical protein
VENVRVVKVDWSDPMEKTVITPITGQKALAVAIMSYHPCFVYYYTPPINTNMEEKLNPCLSLLRMLLTLQTLVKTCLFAFLDKNVTSS